MNPALQSPYLSGPYAPVHDEIDSGPLAVIGELPRDLRGVFVRNSSNPRFAPKVGTRYHWFDGDGMLQGVHFEGGQARYATRWVRTRAFAAESEAGCSLWTGVTERPDFTNPRGPFKDSANTDVVYHAGRLLALWWLGGEPYAVHLPDLTTIGPVSFGSVKTLSAHPKRDAHTGELLFFDYKPTPPFLSYGVLDEHGALRHHTTIELDGPRLQHDMAITQHHTILMDMSLRWDPQLLRRGQTRVVFDRERPARFAVLPRYGNGSEVRWFSSSPFYMYHTINAWEEGNTIVLVGCRIDAPLVGDPHNPERTVPSIGFLRLEPRLCRWTLDLCTGETREELLDDELTEFPRMDNRHLGRPSRYSYNPTLAPRDTLLFDGVVKYDTQSGHKRRHQWPKGRFGGEVVFAPRADRDYAADHEDDGYLITYVTDDQGGAAEAVVLDAREPERPPLCRVLLPQRVPAGYHTWWVSHEDLDAQRPLP